MHVINSWEANPPVDFPNYKSGAEGREEAEIRIAKFGDSWI